jgi:hypothetical protein
MSGRRNVRALLFWLYSNYWLLLCFFFFDLANFGILNDFFLFVVAFSSDRQRRDEGQQHLQRRQPGERPAHAAAVRALQYQPLYSRAG